MIALTTTISVCKQDNLLTKDAIFICQISRGIGFDSKFLQKINFRNFKVDIQSFEKCVESFLYNNTDRDAIGPSDSSPIVYWLYFSRFKLGKTP